MRILIVSCVLLVAAGFLGFQHKSVDPDMPAKYRALKSHCLGRNLIKIPADFMIAEITVGTFRAANLSTNSGAFEVSINNTKKSKYVFLNHVRARHAELLDNDSTTSQVLRLEKKLTETATLFRVQEIEDAYRSELHFLLDESLVIVKIDSYQNTFLAAEDLLVKFMGGFTLVDYGDHRGFCLGTVAVHGDFVRESGSYYFLDGMGNTLDIAIDTFRANDPAAPLLKRVSGPDSLLNIFHIRTSVLRSGERTVAGMRAQEWLGWTNMGQDGDVKTFKFTMETMRPTGGKMTPLIQVTFDSAQPLKNGTLTKTTMSDYEAAAVWDTVINSIQPAK